jgi:adenylate kinase family enzyme
MLDILSRRLQQPDALASSTILLDGFPRTRHQAKALNKMLTVDRVVLLQAQEELCVDRINHRRIDPVSHLNYHTLLIPAPTAQIAARLVRRETDLDENRIRGRLQFFQQNLASILAVFPGKLFALNSAVSIQEELSALQQILSEPIVVEARKDPDPSSMPANPNSNNKVAKPLCVVCMVEEADGVVLPCGHLCGCEPCLNILLNSGATCPICRAHMNSVVKVFQSGVVEEDMQVEQKQPEVVPAQVGCLHFFLWLGFELFTATRLFTSVHLFCFSYSFRMRMMEIGPWHSNPCLLHLRVHLRPSLALLSP